MDKRVTSLRVSAVDKGGSIVVLNDGSRWRISGSDIEKTINWYADQQISLIEGVDDLFPYRLVNLDHRGPDIVTATRAEE